MGLKVELNKGTVLSLGRHRVVVLEDIDVEIEGVESVDQLAEVLADEGANFALNVADLTHTERVLEGRTEKTFEVSYGVGGQRNVKFLSEQVLPSAQEEANERAAAEEKERQEVAARAEAERLAREDAAREAAGGANQTEEIAAQSTPEEPIVPNEMTDSVS
jgi:hypothetical protein